MNKRPKEAIDNTQDRKMREIPHPTECFVKLNIGGAVCLLDKIL